MFAVLAPAKSLDFTPPSAALASTTPRFADDAATLAGALAQLTPGRIARLMKVSASVAKETRAAMAGFAASARGPAAVTFAGEVYRGFDARSLAPADLEWAQDRVGILSGLYGMLRPLDAIGPHRLEMSARLATPGAHNLYAFWGERITQQINALTEGHADRSCLDLSSQENTKVLWPRSLAGPLVTVTFETWKDAARTPNQIPTHSRRARGAMARFVVERRIERVAQLDAFDADGYRLVPERSTACERVFGRPFESAAS